LPPHARTFVDLLKKIRFEKKISLIHKFSAKDSHEWNNDAPKTINTDIIERVISRNFFKFFRENYSSTLYYIISFVLFLKQKFKKKVHDAIFQKEFSFFSFFSPFSSAENLKKNWFHEIFREIAPLLDSLIGKKLKIKSPIIMKINYLFEKHKKKKNQKTFSNFWLQWC